MTHKPGDPVKIIHLYYNAWSRLDGTTAQFVETNAEKWKDRPHLVLLPNGENKWAAEIVACPPESTDVRISVEELEDFLSEYKVTPKFALRLAKFLIDHGVVLDDWH